MVRDTLNVCSMHPTYGSPCKTLSGRVSQLACTSLPLFTGSREFCLFRKQDTAALG